MWKFVEKLLSFFRRKKIDSGIVFVDQPAPVRKRRPPAVQRSYVCDNCGRSFLAYESELPQLGFAKHNDGIMPLIYCNGTRFNCPTTTVPVTEATAIHLDFNEFSYLDRMTNEDFERILAE